MNLANALVTLLSYASHACGIISGPQTTTAYTLAPLFLLAATPLGSASNEHLRGSGAQEEKGLGGNSCKDKRLNKSAEKELEDIGVFDYVDIDSPAQDMNYFSPSTNGVDQLGFTRWSWDPSPEDAPKCLTGTNFAVYFRPATNLAFERTPSKKLVIYFQGGGVCWGGSTPFYSCNTFEALQAPMLATLEDRFGGMFEFDNPRNPIADDDGVIANILYVPYCDGSAWAGGNAVLGASSNMDFSSMYSAQIGQIVVTNEALKLGSLRLPGTYPEPRDPLPDKLYHLGVRNLSAAISGAKIIMERTGIMDPNTIHLIGHSAGGIGVSTIAMPLARHVFKNVELAVMNDAGPIAVNTAEISDLQARAEDWKFSQFYPQSCNGCDNVWGQPGLAFINWYLENDCSVRIAHFSFLNDPVNRRYYRLEDDTVLNGLKYAGLLKKHIPINCKYPERYKNYVITPPVAEGLHGAIQWDYYYDPIPLLPGLPDLPDLPEWTHAFFDNDDVPNIFIIPGSICI